jgi:hypothetical protein
MANLDRGRWCDLPVTKTVVHAEIIIASKITQHSSPASYW